MNKSPSLFQDAGIGVGLRPPYYSEFLTGAPLSVQWVEVISENFMRWKTTHKIWPDDPIRNLEKVRSQIPVNMHGVSLSIGSIDPIDQEYLKRLKELMLRIQPLHVSDHLCWTGVDGENVHDLMPLPYTEEALHHVVAKISQVQEFLGRRLLIENVSSYVEFKESEMSEYQFLSEIAERADCGLLLDINNVYVSSRNHDFDPLVYLSRIPHHRVGQIHLAGHFQAADGFLIDSHDQPVCDDVWRLYQTYCRMFGPMSAMIERDDNFPSWSELEKELQLLHTHTQESRNARSQDVTAPI